MPRKEPLYFKKSKAAKEIELDYDFYSDSDSFLRTLEKDHDRVKPQKTKNQHKYKRTYDVPYYEDYHNERRTHKYDEVLYFDSDDTYDDGDKYLDYVTEGSFDTSDAESVLEGHYHKHKKGRKRRQSENVVYNHQKKHEESNNFRKKRSSPLSYDEDRIIRDKKDLNVYISQRPITLHYESKDDLREPLESITQRRLKSKEHKGIKIPTSDSKPPGDYEIYMTDLKNIPFDKIFGQQQQGDSLQNYSTLTDPQNITSHPKFKELTTNISQNIAQSILRLIYFPIFVLSNNEISQSKGSVKPELLVNSANKYPYGTDVVNDSQNLMTVFTAQNTDQNNLFEHKTKTVNKEREVITPIQRSKENVRKRRSTDTHKKKELKKKLCASSLGTAMSAESYAALIASHPEQNLTPGGTLPSLIKVCKELKKKKGTTTHTELEHWKDENEHQKISSTVKPSNGIKQMPNANTYQNGDHITKQEIEKNKSERKNYSMNSENLERKMNKKKKTAKEGKQLSQIRSGGLEQVDDGKNIIINIHKNSQMSNVLPTADQTKEKEINLNSRVTERQSLVNRKHELTEIKGTESRNFMDSQQTIRDLNIDSTQNQSNKGKKPSLDSKNCSRVSQGSMISGNYKKVGHNQNGTNSLGSFAILKGEKSFVMSQTNDIGKDNSELKENNCKRKTDSANIYKPKATEQTEEGRKKILPQQGDDENIFVAHDKGFKREISLNELKVISGTNTQNMEEEELVNNQKSILKKENLSAIKGINSQEERKMNQNNKNNWEENIRKPQQENENLTKSALNTAQMTQQHLKKPLSASGGKDQEVNGLEKVPQSSLEVLYEYDVEINNSSQIQPNVNYQSVHEQQGDKLSIESLVGKPTIEIIHPPPQKKSIVQSTDNVLFLQTEEPGEPLNDHPSGLFEYTESILIVSLQTAQYILGVSCYDKLINVINFFYYEDD